MTKESRNNLIRCLIFLMIAGGIIFYLCRVFAFPDTDNNRQVFNAFYSEQENTLDGVHLGTSEVTRCWIGAKAFNEYGMAITSLATNSQPLVLTKYLMEEVEKNHDPKLYIIELKWNKGPDQIGDTGIRRVTDSMKQSINRISAINAAIDYALKGDNNIKGEWEDRMSYYFPIIKYHSRWSGGLGMSDILMNRYENPCKGYFLTPLTFRQKALKESRYTEEIVPLIPEMEKLINDLLDYCDTVDADVLFTIPPISTNKKELKQANRAVEIVEARGYTVLNFSSEKMAAAMGIDYNTDYYNARHMNCLGAEKYTMYVADYIAEHYDLDDHRGDPDYESWEEAYQYYCDYTDEAKAKMIR